MKFTFSGILGLILLAAEIQAQSVSTIITNLYEPHYVALSEDNQVFYITDGGQGNRIVKYDQQSGTVTTLAGQVGTSGSANGIGGRARFCDPQGIVYVSQRGGFVVADSGNHTLRLVTPSGEVTTVAGVLNGGAGGYADGAASSAQFSFPYGLAADTNGNVYIADSYNGAIRKLDLANNVTTISEDFNLPVAIAIGDNNDLWVADAEANVIKRISTNGVVEIMAGGGAEFDSLIALEGSLNGPRGLVWAPRAKDPGLYIADTGNNCLRRLYYNSSVNGYSLETTSGDRSKSVSKDGTFQTATFAAPTGLFFDEDVTGLLAVDRAGRCVRSIVWTAPLPALQAPAIGRITYYFDINEGYMAELTAFDTITFHNYDENSIIAIEPPSDGDVKIKCWTWETGGSTNQISVQPFHTTPVSQLKVTSLISQPVPEVHIAAQSVEEGRRPSSNTTAIVRFQVEMPNIKGGNPADFILDDETVDTVFHYTIDGTEPTQQSPHVALSTGGTHMSLSITSNVLFMVKGYRDGFKPSEVQSNIFSVTNYVANKISFGFKDGEASSSFIGAAGQTFYAPVTLTLLPRQKIYSFQFAALVTNLDNAPMVSPSTLDFNSMLKRPVPGYTPTLYTVIPPYIATYDAPQGYLVFTNFSINLLGVGWLERYGRTNLYDTITQDLVTYSQAHDTLFLSSDQKVVLGCYSFQIPTNAANNDQYQIELNNPSGTSDGVSAPVMTQVVTNGSLGGGSINAIKRVTVGSFPYLVGDCAPFRWLNAGDFGDNHLYNNDVMQVFQTVAYRLNCPPTNSDFYNSMDSCNGTVLDFYNGNATNINEISMGDGMLAVDDIYVTFRRSLDPSLTQYSRFWSNGVRYAISNNTSVVIPPTVPSSQVTNRALIKIGDQVVTNNRTLTIPIWSTTASNDYIRVMMLNLTVEPLDGSPALTNTLSLAITNALGDPNITYSGSVGNFSGAWLNPGVAGVSGAKLLGTVTVPLPESITSSSAYLVRFEHFSASPNGFSLFNIDEEPGLITVGSDRSASSQGDGIPDSWRLRYFGTITNELSAASLDPDQDGMTNLQEYNAGTDPLNPASVLRAMNPLKAMPAGFKIEWPSLNGRVYSIEASPSLFGTNWTAIATNLAGTGGMQKFLDTNATGSTRFYRVRLVK